MISPVVDGILRGLENAITEHKLREENTRQLAVTDHLTGLHNRFGFDNQIARLAKERVNGHAFGFFLLLIDLNKLKP